MKQRLRGAAGFTVLELMITIAVAAILLGVGVPAFQDVVRNNRISSQTNILVTALNYARGEAIRRGQPISVCAAAADGASCAAANTANWSNGWLVFTDRAGTAGVLDDDPAVETDDALLDRSEAIETSLQLTTNNLSYVRFGQVGALTDEITFTVRPTTTCVGDSRRTITVTRTGRINSAKAACP